MSGQLRALKNRIRGVESTQKITRAMEMVAAAKLKRYQKMHEQAAPYAEAMGGLLKRLLRTDIPFRHPLLEEREEKETAVLVITSDTGLCGPYNHGLVEETKRFIASRSKLPILIGIGKNGVNALTRAGYAWYQAFSDTKAMPFEFMTTEIILLMEELFEEKKVDAVYAVHTGLSGSAAHDPVTEKLLPFRMENITDEPLENSNPYILEPSQEVLSSRLVPMVFEAKMRMMFLESMISEQMARMNAMSQATKNAKELIDSLVLLRNKVRQAAITNELIEIVSGSKALKEE